MNKSRDDHENLNRLINKYKTLTIAEARMALLDENKHGFGGLEFTFSNALRTLDYNNWSLGQLLAARRIFGGLVEIGSKEKAKYNEILENIQLEIDK